MSLVFLLALASLANSADAPRPNIIVVMPDDVGYGDFSCLGSPIVRTPNIDAFAHAAVRLTDFHVSPTCSPTRCALLTGRHEFKSGVTHTHSERERMSLSATTLAQVLKSAGYTTGIFGKWHLGDEDAYQPDQRGFDEVFIHGGGGIGQTFPGSCGDAPGNTYFDPALRHNGRFEKTHGYCTDLFFDRALQWIDRVRRDRTPFFAYITPNAAHEPLQCPASYAQRHAGKVPENVAKFYGMVENIDDNFGFLLTKLDQWGLADNTLVVFLTDNGGTFGTSIYNAGMRGKKTEPYQGGTRVPSFWRWPKGIPGGRTVDVLTAHIDVFPTLAELAGTRLLGEVRRQVEGRSLMPLLRGTKATWPDRTLVTHLGRWEKGQAEPAKFQECSIRNARYTLVNNTELYDLKADPGETRNVLAEYPAEVAKLRAAYSLWWNTALPSVRENEAAVGPAVNPFKAHYWEQFGGGPAEQTTQQVQSSTPAPSPRCQGGEPKVDPGPEQGGPASPAPPLGKGGVAEVSEDPSTLCQPPQVSPPLRRPNILFLFADDLTFRAVGYAKQTEVQTPNIDRLAARGVTFTHAFIQGGLSNAVCVASRAMLLTGRPLWMCGRLGNCSPDNRTLYPLWGKVLGDAGYRTYVIGKWHNGPYTLTRGYQTIYPTVLGGMLNSTDYEGAAYHRPAPGNTWTPDDPKWLGHWMRVDGRIVHSSERWASAAIRDMEEASKGHQPFFVYTAFYAPHDPRQSPRAYLDRYPADSLAVPPNFLPRHPFDIGEFQGRDEIIAPYPRTEAIVRTHLQEYYAIITHLDTQIGRILDWLDRSGRSKDTIVVFAADNGLAVGQHGLMGKQNLYDHSVRVPLVLAGPGLPEGKRIDALVYLPSLFATTCELAGVSVPKTVLFPSLVPLIRGSQDKLYDDVYAAYVQKQRMVRTERWKLIVTPDAGVVQLFDIAADPWEKTNLAADPKYADVLDDLLARLRRWMKAVRDPMPFARIEATRKGPG
jgi:arylsulfatase